MQLDVIHANVTGFKISEMNFVCLYGGRTSPNQICNQGALTIFEIVSSKLIKRLVISEEDLIPRYRSSVVSMESKSNEIQIWIFGGRTTGLNVT